MKRVNDHQGDPVVAREKLKLINGIAEMTLREIGAMAQQRGRRAERELKEVGNLIENVEADSLSDGVEIQSNKEACAGDEN